MAPSPEKGKMLPLIVPNKSRSLREITDEFLDLRAQILRKNQALATTLLQVRLPQGDQPVSQIVLHQWLQQMYDVVDAVCVPGDVPAATLKKNIKKFMSQR